MDIYRTEEEQIQALKQWWKKNGVSVIGGIIIGAGCIFGWRGWQTYLILQSQAASDIYQEMISAAQEDRPEDAQNHAHMIREHYESTPYGQYAALSLAKYAVENSDYAVAEDQLRWVMDNASQEQIRHIARLRLARILLAGNKLTEAQALVERGGDQGAFTASYEEIKGDIYVRQNNREAAREAYIRAKEGGYTLLQTDLIIDIKLEDLG